MHWIVLSVVDGQKYAYYQPDGSVPVFDSDEKENAIAFADAEKARGVSDLQVLPCEIKMLQGGD